MSVREMPSIACPVPLPVKSHVVLGHGSGGRLSAALMRDIFLPAFGNPVLNELNDQAAVRLGAGRVAFSTDSYVVKPLFFPGGGIGELAVYGTVNDLAVGGAVPQYLSAAFILEEGLPLETLQRVVEQMAVAARRAGVSIVTGDTKVVEKGSGDQIFITTAGIGVIPDGLELGPRQVREGDRILLSGPIGEHGVTILAQREGLEVSGDLVSDTAPLTEICQAVLKAAPGLRTMRDLTRGGLSSAVNEIAGSAGVGISLEERAIPVSETVQGICELFGLDPMYVANEGKMIAIVAPEDAEAALAAMRGVGIGAGAQVIGTVTSKRPGCVVMRTKFGTDRIVDMLAGDQLPRIC
ncbi:MAG: hydrogenase expression/formation protein HypE [Acidobacteriaceae bacterium]